MNTQGCKGLCSALAEANIADSRGVGAIENIFNGVGYVVPCKIVDTCLARNKDTEDGSWEGITHLKSQNLVELGS